MSGPPRAVAPVGEDEGFGGRALAWTAAGFLTGQSIDSVVSSTQLPWWAWLASASVTGVLAAWAGRPSAAAREAGPAVLNARGELVDVAGEALGVPLLVCTLSGGWLAVYTTVKLGHPAPVLVYAGCVVAAGLMVRASLSRWRLGLALRVVVEHPERAGGVLEALANAWWPTPSVRSAAAVNRGLVALNHGALGDASLWLARGRTTAAAGFATVAQALVLVLQDRLDEAQRVLGELTRAQTQPVVRHQADEVRALLVLRQHGAEAAQDLIERLVHPGSGPLLLGLRVALGGPAPEDVVALRTVLMASPARWVPEIAAWMAREA